MKIVTRDPLGVSRGTARRAAAVARGCALAGREGGAPPQLLLTQKFHPPVPLRCAFHCATFAYSSVGAGSKTRRGAKCLLDSGEPGFWAYVRMVSGENRGYGMQSGLVTLEDGRN
ncbi:hypothetical protein [Mobiluncus mulieris]|uniref:hypothetical protein n=1 Tax=Mobiluncus mulieris TaxID=2052 RepID=UPI00242BE56C|nr:hypothetical protein [Mobiluncus mulieris]